MKQPQAGPGEFLAPAERPTDRTSQANLKMMDDAIENLVQEIKCFQQAELSQPDAGRTSPHLASSDLGLI